MDKATGKLLQLCTTDAMRRAAIECLATGMDVEEIIELIEQVEAA